MHKKTIWITGASSGIGKELAIEFSNAGYFVVLSGRRKAPLVKIVSEIKKSGGEAEAFVCDVMSEKSILAASKSIIKKYGKIDILVNNAGVTVFKSIMDTTTKDFDSVLDTNLRGAFLCIKSVLPQMINNKNGQIINILSVAANTAFENSTAYAASKAGLLALSNSLREEIRDLNIKVSNILPGAVETPMWDSKSRQKFKHRMMSTTDIAKIVVTIAEQPLKVLIEDITIRPIKGDI